jgi:hypothetical protein
MNNKLGKLILALWLTLGIACFVFGVYETIAEGIKKSYMLFILSIISLLMFYIRRKVMKKALK